MLRLLLTYFEDNPTLSVGGALKLLHEHGLSYQEATDLYCTVMDADMVDFHPASGFKLTDMGRAVLQGLHSSEVNVEPITA